MSNTNQVNVAVLSKASGILASHQIPSPAVSDSRSARRQRIAAAGFLFPGGSTDFARAIKILVLDFSITGIAFRTSLHSMRGDKFKIELAIGPMKVASNIEIAWCRPRADTYLCGASFVE